MQRDWTDGGFWSGSESKWLSWLEDEDDDNDNDFVVNLNSDAMRYNGVDTDGDNSIDIICPYFRQAFEAYQRCDFVGTDEDWAKRNWHDWDGDVDFVEHVLHEDGQRDNMRRGEDSGIDFPCYDFGSDF